MLGRPGIWEPLCINVTPGPWLIDSVNIDRTKQSWSAIFAVWGNRSLIHAPLWPYCEKPKGEPTSGIELWLPDMPVRR